MPVASRYVKTELLFTEPPYNKRSSGAGIELPANKPVKMLISFTNEETEANRDFKLDYVEGFLRYPSDYTYYLQNFTARPIDISVEPKREVIESDFRWNAILMTSTGDSLLHVRSRTAIGWPTFRINLEN